jgi:Fic family protein
MAIRLTHLADAEEAIAVDTYRKKTEKRMRAFYQTLSEKERRRYAAIEAEKLGHGGADYIARLFDVDPKTIRRGLAELDSEETLAEAGERKKGAEEKVNLNSTRN